MNTQITHESPRTPTHTAPVNGEKPTEKAPRVAWSRPPVDIAELDGGLALVFDMPGVPKDAVSVTVDGRVLTVEGKRTPSRGYRHAFTLPDTLDASSVEATLADGVLTVQLARTAKAEPKRIAVH